MCKDPEEKNPLVDHSYLQVQKGDNLISSFFTKIIQEAFLPIYIDHCDIENVLDVSESMLSETKIYIKFDQRLYFNKSNTPFFFDKSNGFSNLLKIANQSLIQNSESFIKSVTVYEVLKSQRQKCNSQHISYLHLVNIVKSQLNSYTAEDLG